MTLNQAVTSGLLNYKPINLMIETNINLDNQLGVKKLVPIHNARASNTTTSAAKPRLNNWSTNNGSVIYTQPTANHHSSIKYLKGTNGIQNVLAESRKFDGNQIYGKIRPLDGAGTKLSHQKDYQLMKDTNELNDENLSGEDLNNKTELATKWSSGTGTTSDLLF